MSPQIDTRIQTTRWYREQQRTFALISPLFRDSSLATTRLPHSPSFSGLPPKDKNLTSSSKCLSPSPFLLFSSRNSYITNHMGPAYSRLLCSGCMKPWCGLGLLGRKAELYEQVGKARPGSQGCWACPCTGFQQVQLFIKGEVCQSGTSAPSAGVVCAHQRAQLKLPGASLS